MQVSGQQILNSENVCARCGLSKQKQNIHSEVIHPETYIVLQMTTAQLAINKISEICVYNL